MTQNTTQDNPKTFEKSLNHSEYRKIGINPSSKHFKRFYKAGLLNKIDETFAIEVRDYWKKHYNKKIDPVLHMAFYNLTGKKEPKLIPSREMWNEFIPYLNDMNIRIGYSDKNIYDKLIPTDNSAQTVLKSVRGNYFDANNQQLKPNKVYQYMLSIKEDLIIKPSDSDNGQGVAKIIYTENNLYLNKDLLTIQILRENYGPNFIVQKVIKQHPIMAAPHPDSVNTLRMVTVRWNNKIHYLLTFARFGANGDVRDNAGVGGLCVGVTDSGEFYNFGIDEDCNIYKKHPTTDFLIDKLKPIPNFEQFKQFVINIHKDILHHDFVSFDIAVGIDSQPIFLEANFRGATWLYQLASQQMFGDLTEDILQTVRKDLEEKSFKRDVKPQLPIRFRSQARRLKTQNKKLNSENKKLELQTRKQKKVIERKQKELTTLKKEYKKTLNSKSWKITAPLRKIGALLK